MEQNTPPFQPSSCTAIIVAAGTGVRFGEDLPKQYHKIHGKAVLRHTLEVFEKLPEIGKILVVISRDFEDHYKDCIRDLTKLLPHVYGGGSRQESVYNALTSLSLHENDVVLIHDAARPCVTSESILSLISKLKDVQAASLAAPVADTLRKVHKGEFNDYVSRDELYAMQTPQGFHFGIIKKAHEKFKGQNFTDDTSLISELDIPVHMVNGNRENIKITTKQDLAMAEKFLAPTTFIPRAGLGFDVHAFGDASTSIRIGGVDIPHSHKLKGHSDADVLLHAITDALYGVIADGDIGSHFPPSNPNYKGVDSGYFLQEAAKAVWNKGGKIAHIDTVVMCEAPKIGPHREAIQKRIADILCLAPSRVSIKATTTEELGFTGRREGIAAQAIVTVLLPDDISHDI